TTYKTAYFTEPLKVLFFNASDSDCYTAAILNTTGGLMGGDKLELKLVAEPGTDLTITSQAAERIYKSQGEICTVDIDIFCDQHATFEWLPLETIFFNHCKYRRNVDVHLQENSVFFAGEMYVFGRKAHGEKLENCLIHDCWNFHLNGKKLFKDLFHLEGNLEWYFTTSSVLKNINAYAICFFFAKENEVEPYSLIENDILASTTYVNQMQIFRVAGVNIQKVREVFIEYMITLRNKHIDRKGDLPRFWYI
ncbi:MAG: hypothetical protein K940chlam3_01087, partial [Chlamydiae bacterium]|nr:hypothetical protein [Chlamydiota bacterium]